MTDKEVQRTKYKYDLNASLVIKGSANLSREKEPDGEGSTLAGKSLAPFGDRAQTEKLQDVFQQKQKKQSQAVNYDHRDAKDGKGKKTKGKEVMDSKKSTKFNIGLEQNVLNVQIQEDLVYRPKTKETKVAYEQILYIVQKHSGDHSVEILKGATDEVIAILKSDTMNDITRKKEIESILDRLSDDAFNSLTVLSQQLVDYNPEDEYQGEKREKDTDLGVQPFDEDCDDESDEEEVKDEDDEQEIYGNEEAPIAEDNESDTEKQQKTSSAASKEVLGLNDIDAHWLKRILSKYFQDRQAEDLLELEAKVLTFLKIENARECEKKLAGLLNFDKFELIKILVKNRYAISFGVLMQQAQTKEDKIRISQEMESSKDGRELLIASFEDKESRNLLNQVDQLTKNYNQPSVLDVTDMVKKRVTDEILGSTKQKIIDLDHIAFQQGARLMANKKCLLPKGSQRIQKLGYEEVYVPAVRHKRAEGDKLVQISELPEWARTAFPSQVEHLNEIQSRLYKAAFTKSENLLVCAPTGAGKTFIALLAILKVLSDKRKSNGKFDIKNFKVVYIAPMKALVTEIVGNFQQRLSSFGITVKELTGDVHLTKAQIDETQIIVTTPEKWDIITRKSGDRAFIELVKLIIIDEIHLLHDSRGPVLEAIVARTIRQIESTSELVRLVALSATLPNYEDVATFLRVKPESGLFFFDNSFRPVPLEQIYVGVTEKKAIKRMMLMNEICYEKIMERAGKHQILVFVHSRKETSRTAKIIRDMALAKDELMKFLKDDSQSKEFLEKESETAKSQDVKDLIIYGIGIHHAGLARNDRLLVEQLFAAGHIQVLVSTATLAWGVNLPAHTVIIKGTQVYSPEQGKWIELSPQDMLQMMGRAGRPQYDKLGEGIIITNHSELQYHLSLNNQQLPIESQLISQLADQINGEVVLGTISSIKEAVNWLAYTYLYVRMLRAPDIYGIEQADILKDPMLVQHRADLVHTAAMILAKAQMIKYDKRTGIIQSTAIGKVASHYYIKHNSMSIYNENLKPHMNIIDVLRLFSLSKEFQLIPIRENERLELQKFIDKVPIPVKGSLEESATKINILLQAYISRFKMDGYDLNADMVYVTQSASRILRCLFEICVKRGWAQVSEVLLSVCKMVERRQWSSMTPLRQFSVLQDYEDILRRIEKKEQFTWQHFYEMSQQQIGEIVKFPKIGKIIHRLVHQFPRLELEAFFQPLTRTIIKVELDITPDFQWDTKIHNKAEQFHILVEDCDSEQILHSEQFILKEKHASERQVVSFILPIFEPMPPQYFIKVISDKWIQSETVLPVSFKHLILPERFVPPMELQDMHSRLVKELSFQQAEDLYFKDGIKEFNAIQTQVFNKLYQSEESIFIGAPAGSGLATCAELAIFREIQSDDFEKIVYIAPVESLCRIRNEMWKERLVNEIGLDVQMLTGVLQQDLAILNKADIIISTPEKWDFISRKWRQRKAVQKVGLYILDELQLIQDGGAVYEVVASRIRYMQNEVERKIRIVAFSSPLANAKDAANWLGISFPSNTFNFHPSVRPVPLEIHIQGFDHNNKQTRVLAMMRPAYNEMKKNLHYTTASQAIVFVSDRKQARLSALDIITFSASDESPKRFLGLKEDSQEEKHFLQEARARISEETLIQTLGYGVAYIHDGMSNSEIKYVKDIYNQGIVRVMVVIYSQSWEVTDLEAHQVLIIDAERYDGVERRFVEYSIPDMLQMMGRANKTQTLFKGGPQLASKCSLYCHTPKKEYFIKFLQEPLPIESFLDHYLHDHINADVAAGTIENKQDAVDWITWTFMYRRISQNPNFYNLSGKSGQHINDHLSELIENTIEDLEKAKCIEVKEDEMTLEIGNLGRIAAFYYIKYQTMELFAKNLAEGQIEGKTMKHMINFLSHASEFESIPIRQGEESLLKSIEYHLTFPIDAPEGQKEVKYNRFEAKTNFLLQCHFNRTPLNPDLRTDQKLILEKSVKLAHAMVDVISSHGCLKQALYCMELSQMLVQAMWVNQSQLLQLPFLNQDQIHTLKSKAQVNDIVDFMNMDDDLRERLITLQPAQMTKLAGVCNRYPNIELSFSTDKNRYSDGEIAEVEVTLSRTGIESDEDLQVFNQSVTAQYFPGEKEEQWWVVIGQPQKNRNKLIGIKKINQFKAVRQAKTKLNFVIKADDSENQGQSLQFKVYLICDSYIGVDQEDFLEIKLQR